jgi:hypothetical protein
MAESQSAVFLVKLPAHVCGGGSGWSRKDNLTALLVSSPLVNSTQEFETKKAPGNFRLAHEVLGLLAAERSMQTSNLNPGANQVCVSGRAFHYCRFYQLGQFEVELDSLSGRPYTLRFFPSSA